MATKQAKRRAGQVVPAPDSSAIVVRALTDRHRELLDQVKDRHHEATDSKGLQRALERAGQVLALEERLQEERDRYRELYQALQALQEAQRQAEAARVELDRILQDPEARPAFGY